jgi:hypothetical protein
LQKHPGQIRPPRQRWVESSKNNAVYTPITEGALAASFKHLQSTSAWLLRPGWRHDHRVRRPVSNKSVTVHVAIDEDRLLGPDHIAMGLNVR